MDLTSLLAVLAELRGQLLPARFEKAQQPTAQVLQLGLRSLQGLHWLELSWQAEAPRLHGVAAPPRQGDGSTLAQQLQHGLRGLALVALEQQGWERVVELGFARRPGDPIERWLVLELMGRHSNLFLLDEARQVIALARQVRQQQSRLRPIGTGDPYQCPPPLQGDPPDPSESLAQWRRRLELQDLPLAQALLRSYQGVSPALVQQLLEVLPSAGGAELSVRQLPDASWELLHQRWQQWLLCLSQQRFGFERQGDRYRCWPAQAFAAAAAPCNAGVAAYYAEILGQRRFVELQQQAGHRLEQLQQREREQLKQQQELLAAGEQADALQQQADALLCQAHQDPTAVEQAQALYRRARRLRRSGAVIGERIALHNQRLQWLEASATYVEQAESLSALEPVLADLQTGLDDDAPSQRRRRRQGPPQDQPQPLELASPGGLRLQVGRNHRQNAWISLRQARRGDLWFHAQECPGSHVVLKASAGVCGDADVAAAAHLAAYFSRARGNGRVPVVMVPTDALQRIPGSPPGTVRHSGGTVLWGEPAQARALLASAPSLQAEERP